MREQSRLKGHGSNHKPTVRRTETGECAVASSTLVKAACGSQKALFAADRAGRCASRWPVMRVLERLRDECGRLEAIRSGSGRELHNKIVWRWATERNPAGTQSAMAVRTERLSRTLPRNKSTRGARRSGTHGKPWKRSKSPTPRNVLAAPSAICRQRCSSNAGNNVSLYS